MILVQSRKRSVVTRLAASQESQEHLGGWVRAKTWNVKRQTLGAHENVKRLVVRFLCTLLYERIEGGRQTAYLQLDIGTHRKASAGALVTSVVRSLREWHGARCAVASRRRRSFVDRFHVLLAVYSLSPLGGVEARSNRDGQLEGRNGYTLNEEGARGWRRSEKERAGGEGEKESDRRGAGEEGRKGRAGRGIGARVFRRQRVRTERVQDPKKVTDYGEGLLGPKKLAGTFGCVPPSVKNIRAQRCRMSALRI